MKTFYAALALAITLAGCAETPPSATSNAAVNGYGTIHYFSDLRTVPIDKSNLAPGPQVLAFRATAFESGVGTVAWDDARRALLKAEITAAKGGPNPQFVPAEVVFKDVPGQANELDVTVTVNLDGPGTWQIDLPRVCYDYAAMGFNGPEVLGLKATPPTPAGAQRPDALGCVATAVLTVGSCPHIVHSERISGGKGQASDVWRVLWSEPISGKGVSPAKFQSWKKLATGTSEAWQAPTAAKEDAGAWLLTIDKGDVASYSTGWLFDLQEGVAAKYYLGAVPYTYECTPYAGSMTVAGTDQTGEPYPSVIPKVIRGVLAAGVEAKANPPKK